MGTKEIILQVVETARLLFLLFLGLKLSGVISWGWLWVFSPIWLPLVCWGGYVLVQFIRAILEIFKTREGENGRNQ